MSTLPKANEQNRNSSPEIADQVKRRYSLLGLKEDIDPNKKQDASDKGSDGLPNIVFGKFSSVQGLLQNNQRWAQNVSSTHPGYFEKLSAQQSPKVLWIGCSDSRVPANQIVALDPGEIFVHRNIANVVLHSDINCLSVLQYAVEVLKVQHVIVTGHYGCGGVLACMNKKAPLTEIGLLDCWLRNMKDIYEQHQDVLNKVENTTDKANLMCEINVLHSVQNVCKSTIVQNAWARGQTLSIHGWCYKLRDGTINDLSVDVHSAKQIGELYHVDIGRMPHGPASAEAREEKDHK